jgi:hypothetical protein
MSILDIFGLTRAEAPTSPQDIKRFIAEVKKDGLSRTNRFGCTVDAPKTLRTNPAFAAADFYRKLFLYCESINIPGVNISTTPARTFGETREMPYEKVFDPVTANYYIDTGFKVKAFFEAWQDSIQNTTDRTIQFYDNYVSTVHLFVNDVANNTRYLVKLHEAYPKTVQSINLAQGSNEVAKLNVTFAYKYFTTSLYAPPPKANKGWIQSILEGIQNAGNQVLTDPAGVIVNSLPVAANYFSDFAGFQDTFTGLSNSISNNRTNQFAPQYEQATPEILDASVRFSQKTLDGLLGNTFRTV